VDFWSEERPLHFGHYEAVASLSPDRQLELLDKAEQETISVAGLRVMARRVRNPSETPRETPLQVLQRVLDAYHVGYPCSELETALRGADEWFQSR